MSEWCGELGQSSPHFFVVKEQHPGGCDRRRGSVAMEATDRRFCERDCLDRVV